MSLSAKPMSGRVEHIGDAMLILGDCREWLASVPTCFRVDAVVTDPPYGIGLGVGNSPNGLNKDQYESYSDTLETFRRVVVPAVTAALGVAKRGAVFCNNNLHELPKPDAIGGVYLPAASGRHCWGFNSLSPISFYGRTPLNGSYSTVLPSSETAEKNGHPCPKPIGWMLWLVGRASLPAETVLDPFMGSGTTGVAAIKLGRKFIGIEIEPKYFDIACRRIEEATRQADLFIERPPPPKQEVLL